MISDHAVEAGEDRGTGLSLQDSNVLNVNIVRAA
jgi:hypothetical protein